MEEEEYEFQDGVMMKKNKDTGEWETAERKEKDYEIDVKTAGGKKVMASKPMVRRKIYSCLVESRIPFHGKTKPIAGDKEQALELLLEQHEELITHVTKARAEKFKKCMEPIADLVNVTVRKRKDLEEAGV